VTCAPGWARTDVGGPHARPLGVADSVPGIADLEPLATSKMPLSSPPPRRSRFGGPLALSKVHWVRPELVAEITYLGWTDEPLLRHTVFVGLREDKPAREVRREVATRP